jgi:hypothetical protein
MVSSYFLEDSAIWQQYEGLGLRYNYMIARNAIYPIIQDHENQSFRPKIGRFSDRLILAYWLFYG